MFGLSFRGYLAIGGALAVAAVVAAFFLWINGLHRQIARAQAEARAAHVQTAHAVLYGVNRQAQVFADVASIAALRDSIARQNAAVAAAEAAGRQRTAELENAAQRARIAAQRASDQSAALLRGRAGPDPCRSAMDVVRSLP